MTWRNTEPWEIRLGEPRIHHDEKQLIQQERETPIPDDTKSEPRQTESKYPARREALIQQERVTLIQQAVWSHQVDHDSKMIYMIKMVWSRVHDQFTNRSRWMSIFRLLITRLVIRSWSDHDLSRVRNPYMPNEVGNTWSVRELSFNNEKLLSVQSSHQVLWPLSCGDISSGQGRRRTSHKQQRAQETCHGGVFA